MLTNISPPGPKQKFSLNADKASFQYIGELIQKYGDIVSLKDAQSGKSQVLINHPAYIKQVFVTEHHNFKKGTGFDRVKLLLGNGLIVSDGDFWARQKRMIQPLLHKNAMKNVYGIMCQCNVNLVEKWKQAGNNPINVTKDTCLLALEIISRALFSEDYATISAERENPFFVLAEHTERDLDLVVKFHALKKHVKTCMHARQKQSRFPNDFLSMLMLSEDKISNQRMTEHEVIDEVMTLIVAAHETTAATINWIWYFISTYPEVRQTILHEMEESGEMEFSDVPPSFEALQKFSYIKQVIDEVLRLYPPGWLLSREVLHQTMIGEYELSAGTNVFISPYYIHRHANYWDEPEKFDPHRFAASNMKNINRYTYFPFSLGQRRCPGEIFALLEMQMHIAYVCKHLQLSFINDKPITLEPLINLRAEQEFYMRAKPLL